MGRALPRASRAFKWRRTLYELTHDVVVDLGCHGMPGFHLIVDSDPSISQALTLLNASSLSRFGILTPTPARLILHFDPCQLDGTLRLLIVGAGGTADEASITALDSRLTSVDILVGGHRNHIDVNLGSSVRLIEISGKSTCYLDFDFEASSRPRQPLLIDARQSSGLVAVFVADRYTRDFTLLGSRDPESQTLLGLQVTGAAGLPRLERVQGLILQKGSNGSLDLGGNPEITHLELQPLGSRPGEDRAFASLFDVPRLRSALFVGGGDPGPQRFPGLLLGGQATLPGRADVLDVSYENRGTALADGSGLSHADPLRFDGAEQVRIDATSAIGGHGDWSLPGLIGDCLQQVVLTNPSLGHSDLGLLRAGSGPGRGSLQRLDASAVSGPLRLLIAADSLAPGATLIGGSGGVSFDWIPTDTDGPLSVLTGDGDDEIVFGGTAATITSGLGRDRFRQAAANGGQLDRLTTLNPSDSGPSNDVIELMWGGVNDRRMMLQGSGDAADFCRQVQLKIQQNSAASGLYVETMAGASGPVTYAYLNSGQQGFDHLFALPGVHSPGLLGTTLSLG